MPLNPKRLNTFDKLFKEKVFNPSDKDEEQIEAIRKVMKKAPPKLNTKKT